MNATRRTSGARLRRLLPAVTSVLAVSLALTACDSGGSTGDGAADGKLTLTESTPAAVGDVDSVTWALPYGEPRSLDPAKTGDYSANSVVTNLCESLLRLQPDFSTTPGLAEVVQKDATTVVITLRSGVTFWDGAALTADDVVYSLKRNMDPKLASYAAHVFFNVASIEATGPLEVTVRFRVPDVQFVNNMAGVPGMIMQQSFTTKAGPKVGTPSTGVMCTGPFSVGSWKTGQSITLKRNPTYWDADRKAKAATFEFVFLSDDSTLTSALLSGEVDGVYGVPLGGLAALRRSDAGTVYFGESTETYSLGATSDQGPAADPRIREALDLAIDKNSFATSVLKGTGRPLKTFTPPLVWAGSPAKAVYDAGYEALPDTSKADLEKAKKLVAEAAPSRKTLTLAVPAGNQSLLQTATLAQDAAKKLGLTLTIKQLQPTQFSGLFYDPAARAQFDLVATTGYVEVPGVLYYAPGFALKGGLFNWTNYSDPSVTKNLTAAVSATDPTTSAEAFVAAQEVFAPARLQITLAESYNRLFLNKRITGAPASFAYISSPWAALVGKAKP
ncbi:ABC transporter substrate-binding protein [Cryptosporangium aurantiacum]|uniref:Peptide/nickel transport system substrate-binding protein n=1 Tax=Cryptosporangium aurantiacum TaxID=134849 RepID=A0A1M7PRP3_9ACTN|nr:ABC transporter substrate-binding protein [Cryptosporangium aurantiacum]SHN20061.1 peptide/nickel transport system substrate-binding protein [Cryptosporangium aurantiacum]